MPHFHLWIVEQLVANERGVLWESLIQSTKKDKPLESYLRILLRILSMVFERIICASTNNDGIETRKCYIGYKVQQLFARLKNLN